MENKRVWHSGPPPHIGWWNASHWKNPNQWRWWNGKHWSAFAYDTDTANIVSYISLVQGVHTEHIKWTNYWPNNARVKRIKP
jgi:hypothetical protein